jgi:hypothetical protein
VGWGGGVKDGKQSSYGQKEVRGLNRKLAETAEMVL